MSLTSDATSLPAATTTDVSPTSDPPGPWYGCGTGFPAGTALLYVTAGGLMPPGYEPGPAVNVTISAQRGGDGNTNGEEFARGKTNDGGCVTFTLPAAGTYRFDTVPGTTCDPAGYIVAEWNGTGILDLHLSASMPCS